MMPLVQLPPGSRGELRLIYRPWWLTLGASIAGVAMLILIGSTAAAVRSKH
jgi:hypothetical protein